VRLSNLAILYSFACQKVAQPLESLLSAITIPPQVALTILDTPVSDKWIPPIHDLEALLDSLLSHGRRRESDSAGLPAVKAAKDIEGVAEGLRIVASHSQTHYKCCC
jgi:hypothetical protein